MNNSWTVPGSYKSTSLDSQYRLISYMLALIITYLAWKRKRISKKKVKDNEATPEHNGTILLLALTSGDKKLEIHIPCPDAKAVFLARKL